MYPKIMNEHTIAGIGISTTGIVDINKGIVTGGADHIPDIVLFLLLIDCKRY